MKDYAPATRTRPLWRKLFGPKHMTTPGPFYGTSSRSCRTFGSKQASRLHGVPMLLQPQASFWD